MYYYNKTAMDKRVFEFIYGCALADAVLQRAFTGERTWITDVSEAKSYVKKYVDDILAGRFAENNDSARDSHEKMFLETSLNVCRAVNDYAQKPDSAGNFSFGNAQKLINITIKHVYLHTYTINALGYPSVREHFRYCHCPMDSIMLQDVWKRKKHELSSDFRKAWGNEDFELDDKTFCPCLPQRYKRFQKMIRDIIKENNGDIFPIEYDCIVWKH